LGAENPRYAIRSSNLRPRNTPCARLPTIFNFRDFVQAGALMSYGLNVPALFRRAAELLDKILRGTKPADIPVEQPTTFRLVVNLKTAKALGLTIPESFLLRADTVAGTKCEFRLVRVTTAHE
jgi:ABC-type uncharacterized transport system substrate-binding protein